jgi:iron(III) transport system substrate-binding protein
MYSRRSVILAGVACAVTGCDIGSQIDKGRQALSSWQYNLPALARKEGALRVDAATDERTIENVLDAFAALYPGIVLQQNRPTSKQLQERFLTDVAAGHQTADILISPAMDLQFKLVNDGLTQAYESPEKVNLPDWAVWKNHAYALTAEPLAFVYNRALMPTEDVPSSHDELTDLLRRKPQDYRGKIATYDPELSATGYLYYTQDLMISRDTLDLMMAVGRTQPSFYVSGRMALDKIVTGEHVFAYNMISSYVFERHVNDPHIGIVFPSDYTLVMSHTAVIPRMARHPAAARLFLDFLLSETGQAVLSNRHLQPIRLGMGATRESMPLTEILRPIRFGPSLLANLDEIRRTRLLREWRQTFES